MAANDCPYNCVNGKLFNVALKRLEACPHCSQKHAKEVKTNQVEGSELSLCEQFNVRKSLTGTNFSMEAIIPIGVRGYLQPDSIAVVEDVLKKISLDISIGLLPDHSYLFNLGDGGNIDAFAYQYMMKAYKNNLSIAPMISARDILMLRRNEELEEISNSRYEDLLRKEVLIAYIDAGSLVGEVSALKGVVQLRARNELPTLMFTLSNRISYMNALSLYNVKNAEYSMQNAEYVGVVYYSSEHNESSKTEDDFGEEYFQRRLNGEVI